MLNIALLLLSAVLIPIIILMGIKTCKPQGDGLKLLKGLVLALFGTDLLRFFYSASLYDKGFLPAKELPFSYLSLLIIFALFAIYNRGKHGIIFKKFFVLSSLIPVIFPLFAPRIYLNTDDTYFVTTALYFIEVGLITSLATLFVLRDDHNIKPLDLLLSAGVFLVYIGIAIGLNFGWQLEIPFDLNFFLGYGLALLSIGFVYLLILLKRHFSPVSALVETETVVNE